MKKKIPSSFQVPNPDFQQDLIAARQLFVAMRQRSDKVLQSATWP
jgi:hypothetical protein